MSERRSYSAQEIERMKNIPLKAVLAACGKDTRDNGKSMFFSPFRDEKTPSFHILPEANAWYDFGLGEGGDVFSLVERLMSCGFSNACEFLSGIDPSALSYATGRKEDVGERDLKLSAIEIESVSERFQPVLMKYARGRGINRRGLLGRYCREVVYHRTSDPSRHYFSIGFPNNAGGYALRSGAKGSKVCTKADVTTIGPDGTFTTELGHGTVMVFEGFFDFLSWLEWAGRDVPACDVVVLNSTSNLRKAGQYLSGHRCIGMAVDNDEAGDGVVRRVRESCGDADVKDVRRFYAGYNDFNEMLVNEGPMKKKGMTNKL